MAIQIQALEPQCQRMVLNMFVLLTVGSGVGGPGSLFEEQTLESASFSKSLLNLFLSEVNRVLFSPQTTERLNFSPT